MSRPGQDVALDTPALKAMLLAARQQPIACAVGVTQSKTAVISMSKTQSPKALESKLKQQLSIATSRYGHVSVDGSLVVTFQLQKTPPPLLDRQLVAALKGTGYFIVNCVVDEAADDEAS